MTVESPQEGWDRQVFAQSRLFFALARREGFDISIEIQAKLTERAILGAVNHVSALRVEMRRPCGFKTFAFLSYEFAKWVASRSAHIEPTDSPDPTRLACRIGTDRLNALLSLETNSATKLSVAECGYHAEMLYAEVVGREEIGIGPNGLAAVFGMLSRHGNQTPDLDSV